eukprot:366744-Amphidinium_carterae.2
MSHKSKSMFDKLVRDVLRYGKPVGNNLGQNNRRAMVHLGLITRWRKSRGGRKTWTWSNHADDDTSAIIGKHRGE